ncbi:methyltransferase domain-containing protein [Phytohabitans aurantiacus]|nr:methyltransferase domain-containing protein [Phytohabitans aurantiacus]
MIIYRVEVEVRPEQLPRATTMFAELVRQSRQVLGVRHFDILQDPDDGCRFVSVEVFEDRAAVDRQSALPLVGEVISAFDGLLRVAPRGSAFHVSASEPWPTPRADRSTDDQTLPYQGFAEEYDRLLGDLAVRTWQQGILAELARIGVPAGATVVDLAAGTGVGGRLLRSLDDNLTLVGLDASIEMLRQAGGSYRQLVEADLCQIPLPSGFADVTVSGFDSLNYLDGTRLGRCLGEVGRVLKPGGWLVFDYSSPHLLCQQWRDHHHTDQLADGTLHWRHRADRAGSRCVTTLTRYDQTGAVRWEEQHVQYALDAFQVHRLAESAGLRVDRVRDLHRAEFSPSASTHVWSLRKGDG